MSIEAIRLLQLKMVARIEPDRPAEHVVPQLWIVMLVAVRKLRRRSAATLTVGQFYRELAKLGGFIGRKGDGQPGWITVWRGWEKLHLMVRGSELAAELRSGRDKCG